MNTQTRFGILLGNAWFMLIHDYPQEGGRFEQTTSASPLLESTFETEAEAMYNANLYELDGFTILPVTFRVAL